MHGHRKLLGPILGRGAGLAQRASLTHRELHSQSFPARAARPLHLPSGAARVRPKKVCDLGQGRALLQGKVPERPTLQIDNSTPSCCGIKTSSPRVTGYVREQLSPAAIASTIIDQAKERQPNRDPCAGGNVPIGGSARPASGTLPTVRVQARQENFATVTNMIHQSRGRQTTACFGKPRHTGTWPCSSYRRSDCGGLQH